MGFEEVPPNEPVESKNIVCHRSQQRDVIELRGSKK